MKLFLSSSGLEPGTQEAFLELLGKDPKETKLAFIPTAAGPERDKSYVKKTRDEITATGISAFDVDLIDESESSLYEKLKDADVICVNGGNTFYLLDWAKRSGFDKVVKKLLLEGKIYFGVSAGSYIACPTIEAAKWKHTSDPDVVGKSDLSALGLVDFLMIAHYAEKYKEDVGRGAKTTDLPVIAITDQQAVVVDEENTRLAGPDQPVVYNNYFLNRTIAFVDGAFGKKKLHYQRTVDWLLQIEPNADEALLVAAYAHDVERAFIKGAKKKFVLYKKPEELENHQRQSATIMRDFLAKIGATKEFINRVAGAIEKHETGGTFDQNLLKDADSVSYLEVNAPRHIDWLGEVSEADLRKKFAWMFNRISNLKAKEFAQPLYKNAIGALNQKCGDNSGSLPE